MGKVADGIHSALSDMLNHLQVMVHRFHVPSYQSFCTSLVVPFTRLFCDLICHKKNNHVLLKHKEDQFLLYPFVQKNTHKCAYFCMLGLRTIL